MNFLSKLFKTANNIQVKENMKDDIIIKDDDYFKEEYEDDNIEYRGLDSSEQFVRAILGDFGFNIEIISKNNRQKFETISKNFNSSITHPGFIYYLGYCWGKEIGIVLRPDIIWSCILYEFTKHIIETKDKYVDDFNELYNKNNNVYNGYMNSYDLVDKFKNHIKYEEFYRLITKERFMNEPKNFTEIKVLMFSNFARVEYKKFKMNCNIPKFQIKGDKEDWMNLLRLLDILIHLNGNRFFINYLENVKSLVSNIIANTFQVMLSLPKLRYQGIREMIKDIFYIDEGKVKGWGRELYFDCYMNPKRKWELDNFNTHISYIPYINRKDREACIKAGGLCYSMFNNECLEPFYGSILCKSNDVKTFKKL